MEGPFKFSRHRAAVLEQPLANCRVFSLFSSFSMRMPLILDLLLLTSPISREQ